jgi:gliding motility-associated-like protein
MVNFKDVSASKLGTIISTEWQINREEFSFLQNPARIFSEPGAYSVQLKVTDDQGCVDSLNIDSFVTLLGEKVVVDFGLSMLCEDQKNTFKVKDGNANSYEWDMGDGTVLTGDSVEYTYADIGLYQMRLLVSDVSCKYPIQNAVMTEVVRKPVSDFEWTKSCPNQVADFISLAFTSTPINNLRWDIGGAEYMNLDTVPHLIGSVDELTKLVVTDSLGCQDSLTKRVRSYPIKVDFSLDKGFYCLGDSLRISSDVQSDTGVLSILTYQNGLLKSNKSTPVISISEEGYFDLKVIATNLANCSDTSSKTEVLKVAGPNTLSNSVITFLSVGENNGVVVNWDKDTTGLYEKYEVLDRTNQVLWETSDREMTSVVLSGLNPEVSPVCIILEVNNGCNTPKSNKTHCTISSTGESISMARKVNWTPYVGWAEVDGYSVYREGNAGYTLIGSVAGDAYTFTDTVHIKCDEIQKYKVAAYGPHISYSDSSHIKPIWDYEVDAPLVDNITVAVNDWVEIAIDTVQQSLIAIKELEIERTDLYGNTQTWNTDISDRIYDENVEVQNQSYTYAIRQVDQCNAKSLPARDVRSILLQVETDTATNYPKIKWSREKAWEGTFMYYQLYRISSTENGNSYTPIANITDRDDTSYVDRSVDAECTQSACYLVEAVNEELRISKSNINCGGTTSSIFTPNAMTPNGDGLNDTYSPRGLYIAQYHLAIYTRWGEKIFETYECMKEWDGTVKGEKAQIGVYFYVLQATGADKVRHNLNGTITVLR